MERVETQLMENEIFPISILLLCLVTPVIAIIFISPQTVELILTAILLFSMTIISGFAIGVIQLHQLNEKLIDCFKYSFWVGVVVAAVGTFLLAFGLFLIDSPIVSEFLFKE